MSMDKSKIPVTIITGFLGAGKTTLLNRLIREYPEKRYAIIENEFGEIGIDSEMVINIDNNNICELANGCICCTLNDDLADLLKDLLNSGKPFNHLLVETTGIADPAGVVQTFFADQEVKSAFKMDSVICMADAIHFLVSINEQSEIRFQMAMADLVLLNKVGDQKPGTLKEIRKTIREINPYCEILETDFAEIKGEPVLDRYAYGTERVQSFTIDAFRSGSRNRPDREHAITSHSFRLPGTFELERFSYWMEYFLYINQSIVFRIKGILNFDGSPHKMILQSVRSSYLLEDGDYWAVGEERVNRIVFIGKELPVMEIREALESLMI